MAAVLLVSCGPNREERINQIDTLEKELREASIFADTVKAEQITTMYVEFADKYPTDSLAPIYLFKAADVQSNMLHTERAIKLFDRIIADYPDFSEMPTCYYLKGASYEMNSMIPEAKAAYQEYLDKYPDHIFANDLRRTLPLIDMSPEEQLAAILEQANDTIIAQR